MDPGCFKAHVIRCLGYLYLSNFSQAVEDHEQAVALSEGNLVLLERLEELKMSLDLVRASAVYETARSGVRVIGNVWCLFCWCFLTAFGWFRRQWSG